MTVEEICSEFEKLNGMNFQTSGSTGIPKLIFFEKSEIQKSTERTASYFHIDSGDPVFSALPLNFVAGKMMVLRSHLLDWKLTLHEPSALPKITDDYKFAVFTPHQFVNLFENTPEVFSKIQTVLLGGGPFPNLQILGKLNEISSQVFLGYGMTETLTHIAIRNLSRGEEDYLPLPGVQIRVNEMQYLSIKDELLNVDWFETDDLAEISNERFAILGRKSSVINSGGVKIFPEKIEGKIKHLLTCDFYISSRFNSVLGEEVVMVLNSNISEIQRNLIEQCLDKFEKPKAYIVVNEIEKTISGKLIRKKISS